ncbi:hypothetical protein LIA77_10817 [Sarocladium implicatum]|nr:hypothetical protein LIA77_10817 [Sarocladium implicatum]
MTSDFGLDLNDLFDKSGSFVLDNSLIVAYGLRKTPTEVVQQICDNATESYAREVLHWPLGRLMKPDIFRVEEHEDVQDKEACTNLFVQRLDALFQASPPRELPIYPRAFVIVDAQDGQPSTHVTLALAHQVDNKWQISYLKVPVDVELGMEVESLRMGDITAQDVVDQLPEA